MKPGARETLSSVRDQVDLIDIFLAFAIVKDVECTTRGTAMYSIIRTGRIGHMALTPPWICSEYSIVIFHLALFHHRSSHRGRINAHVCLYLALKSKRKSTFATGSWQDTFFLGRTAVSKTTRCKTTTRIVHNHPRIYSAVPLQMNLLRDNEVTILKENDSMAESSHTRNEDVRISWYIEYQPCPILVTYA